MTGFFKDKNGRAVWFDPRKDVSDADFTNPIERQKWLKDLTRICEEADFEKTKERHLKNMKEGRKHYDDEVKES